MAKFDLKTLLSEKSLVKEEELSEKGSVKAFKVISLSVHDLIPSGDNFYSVEGIKELKESIELFGGVKQNLIVKRLEDGKYKVIAGHKRRLASLALVEEGKNEFEFVPCIIEEEAGNIAERLLLIMTNSTARQLTDYEKSRQAEELKELLIEYKKQEKIPGRIRDLVAEILGTSAAQVGRMEAISKNLTDEFKEEWKENKVNMSTAYELSGMPEEKQVEAYEQYKENGGITINEVKAMKKENKAEPLQEEKEEPPLEGQIQFYKEEEKEEEEQAEEIHQEQKKEKSRVTKLEDKQEGCGFCKGDYHTSIATDEGNYLIDIDSENKMVRIMRRECDIETVAFVFCPMCGRRL